jgi:iron complex outermembrane recepter protein
MSVRSFCRVTFAALMVALITVARPLHAQSTGTITGRVTSASTGTPVVGAFILVDGGAPKAQTGIDGRYRVAGVTAGTHTVDARRGTATATTVVDVAGGATATADFTLRDAPPVLAAVTVIGTRTDLDETRERAAQVPGAVTVVGPGEIRATRQANLKDVLQFTPGVYVQPRFGAADESQISVRGSGLRNNFHARGINLLVNGMPYRNADGFTDFESLELLTTEAIVVYKGANALRYGGSTLGGAINLDTKTGHTAGPVSAFVQGGAFGFFKGQLASGGVRGAFDYYASYARTDLDNFRQWSDQKRDRVNLHAGYRLNSKVDARSFYFFAHVREHLPGSLTRAELESDPEQAVATNVTNRWGRDYDLHHAGIQLRAQLTPSQRLEISPYVQYRDIDHPIFEVISQISRDYGAELRYENSASLGSRANRFTFGAQTAFENMDNRQFQNQGGSHGALTRNEKDKVLNLSLYAEDALDVTTRLTAVAGARLDRSRRTVDDFFLTNGDQSDERLFEPLTPRVGLRYDLPGIGGNFFANASRTVEPPLLLELSSFGNAGGFLDLDAQNAWQYEVGARGRRVGLTWELSLYDIELTNEILNINVQPFPGAPFTVPSYRNAGRTRHYGVETGLAWQMPGAVFVRGGEGRDHVTTRVAYTYGQFTYVKDPAYGSNDIPGAPAHHVNAELSYEHPSGFSISPRVEWVPQSYFVNSDNTVKNDAWATLGLRAEWTVARAGVTAFLEGSNLLDERYSGSVQVDNAAGRFYEPADRRAVYAGLRWSR